MTDSIALITTGPDTPPRAFASAAVFLNAPTEVTANPAYTALTVTDLGNRVAELLAHPFMPLIRELKLTDIAPEAARDLAFIGNATKLEQLDLAENNIGDTGAEALASAPLTQLKHLRLFECNIQAAGAAALAQASLPALRALDLGNDHGLLGSPGYNMIGAQGCGVLAASNWLLDLDVLYLPANNIGTQGASSLAELPLNARDVDLSYNSIEAAALKAIATHWSNLESLGVVYGNRLTADEVVDVYDALDGSVIDQEYRPLTADEIEAQFGFKSVY